MRIRRVVLDTSTLVGAALRIGSRPYQAMMRAFGSGEACASADTLAELDRVLKRRKFNRYLDAELRVAFTTVIRRDSRLFEVSEADLKAVRPACRDPKDNQFLALARIAEADATVSSDEDLLVLHPWHEMPIVSLADFLTGLGVVSEPKEVK